MFHSVRARLTLWYTAIVAVVLIAFSILTYLLLARGIRSATDASLEATAHEFAAAFSREHGAPARLDFLYPDREIHVFSPAGQIVASSASRFTPDERKRLAEAARSGRGFVTIDGGEESDGIRLLRQPINVGGERFTVVVAQDLDPEADRLESARHALMLGIPLALLVAAGGGYLMARKSLAPVTQMSVKARHISAETLDERIAIGNELDELGFLAATLNDLLERLQGAFESQRRFMADASHELRTPISIILGEADVALSRPERARSEYRDSVHIMQKAALKLTRIVQNLFLLARTDAGNYPMTKSRFYLDELVADCIRDMRSVAAARNIDVQSTTESDLVIYADEELLQHLILNLIDNAVKFSPDGGRVTVTATTSGTAYELRVTDSGPGIAPSDQPFVFERFFRGSGTQAVKGGGLGLAIARWIATAHDGNLTLERSGESGSTFLVTLPAATENAVAGMM